MSVDHYFTIGAHHAGAGEPCQDYALSGELPGGRSFGVVCDGCSGARGETDIGARVLAVTICAALQETPDLDACFTPAFNARVVELLKARLITANWQDYLATVVAFCTDGERAKVFMRGDGAFCWTTPTGELRLSEVAWPNDMPYYFGYDLNEEQRGNFHSLVGTEGFAVRKITSTTNDLDLDAGKPVLERLTVELLPFSAFEHGHVMEFAPADALSLAVMSDGVSRLTGRSGLHVARDLMGFKNFEGSFVKRRAMRALALCKKEGVIPDDDLAIAAWVRT